MQANKASEVCWHQSEVILFSPNHGAIKNSEAHFHIAGFECKQWQPFYKKKEASYFRVEYYAWLHSQTVSICGSQLCWSTWGMLLFRCLVYVHCSCMYIDYIYTPTSSFYTYLHTFWEDMCCIIFYAHTSNKNQPITAQHLCKQTIFSIVS